MRRRQPRRQGIGGKLGNCRWLALGDIVELQKFIILLKPRSAYMEVLTESLLRLPKDNAHKFRHILASSTPPGQHSPMYTPSNSLL